MKILATFLFITIAASFVQAQDSGSSPAKAASPRSDGLKIKPEGAIYFDAKYNYGALLGHYTQFQDLIKGHPQSLLFSVGFQRYGSKPWEHIFNFITTGLAIEFFFFGNDYQITDAIGFFPYINFPVLRRDRFTMGYRWGWGAGIVKNPFEKADNFKKFPMGSNINVLMNTILEMRFSVRSNLTMTADVGFTHFSNGDVRQPNLGINLLTFGGGLSYTLCRKRNADNCKRTLRFNKDSLPPVDKKIHYNLIAGYSTKQVHGSDNNNYEAFVLTAIAGKAYGRRRRIGIGADLFYDKSLISVYNSDTKNDPVNSDMVFIRPGINISHELVLGTLSAVAQMGVYVYTKYKGDGYFYHRFILAYRFFEHYTLSFAIKSHWANADNIEWGVGYKF